MSSGVQRVARRPSAEAGHTIRTAATAIRVAESGAYFVLEPRQRRCHQPDAEPPRPGQIAARTDRARERHRHGERRRDLRVDRKRIEEERRRQCDCRPGKRRGAGGAGKRGRRHPHQRRGGRGHDDERHDHAGVAAGSVNRRHQHGHAHGMNRVDLVVRAAGEVVRIEIRREVLLVVASRVVVLDLQIAVAPQALGDDQVVRLIAAGIDHRPRQAPGGGAGNERGREPDDERDSGQRHCLKSIGVEHARLPQHPRELHEDDEPDDRPRRSRKHLKHGQRVGQEGDVPAAGGGRDPGPEARAGRARARRWRRSFLAAPPDGRARPARSRPAQRTPPGPTREAAGLPGSGHRQPAPDRGRHERDTGPLR